MSEDFENRNALVTGGSSGIGFSIAKMLLEHNIASVVIVGSKMEKLKCAKENLEEEYPGRVYAINADLGYISEALRIIDDALSGYPFEIEILVNNAGVMCDGLFPNISEAEYDRVMNINLKSVFFLSEYFAKRMIRNHIEGNILMVGSSSSNRPAVNPYMLSKWAIRGLTSGLAKALLPYKIVVNGIAPGPTATPMLNIKDEDLTNLKNPSGRYCTSEEVANLAVLLLGEKGRMIIGELVYISGGAATITYDDQSYILPEF